MKTNTENKKNQKIISQRNDKNIILIKAIDNKIIEITSNDIKKLFAEVSKLSDVELCNEFDCYFARFIVNFEIIGLKFKLSNEVPKYVSLLHYLYKTSEFYISFEQIVKEAFKNKLEKNSNETLSSNFDKVKISINMMIGEVKKIKSNQAKLIKEFFELGYKKTEIIKKIIEIIDVSDKDNIDNIRENIIKKIDEDIKVKYIDDLYKEQVMLSFDRAKLEKNDSVFEGESDINKINEIGKIKQYLINGNEEYFKYKQKNMLLQMQEYQKAERISKALFLVTGVGEKTVNTIYDSGIIDKADEKDEIDRIFDESVNVYQESINKIFKKLLRNNELEKIWSEIDEKWKEMQKRYKVVKYKNENEKRANNLIIEAIDVSSIRVKQSLYEIAQYYSTLKFKLTTGAIEVIKIYTQLMMQEYLMIISSTVQGVSLQKVTEIDFQNQENVLQGINNFFVENSNNNLLFKEDLAENKFIVGELLAVLANYTYTVFGQLEYTKYFSKNSLPLNSEKQLTLIKQICECVVKLNFWNTVDDYPLVNSTIYINSLSCFYLILAALEIDALPIVKNSDSSSGKDDQVQAYDKAKEMLEECRKLLLLKLDTPRDRNINILEYYASIRLLFIFKRNHKITLNDLIREEEAFFQHAGGRDKIRYSKDITQIKPRGHFRLMVERIAMLYLQEEKYYFSLILLQKSALPWAEFHINLIKNVYSNNVCPNCVDTDSGLFVFKKSLRNLEKEKENILQKILEIKNKIFKLYTSQIEQINFKHICNNVNKLYGENKCCNDLFGVTFNSNDFTIDVNIKIDQNNGNNVGKIISLDNFLFLLDEIKRNMRDKKIHFSLWRDKDLYIGNNFNFSGKFSISVICSNEKFDIIKNELPKIIENSYIKYMNIKNVNQIESFEIKEIKLKQDPGKIKEVSETKGSSKSITKKDKKHKKEETISIDDDFKIKKDQIKMEKINKNYNELDCNNNELQLSGFKIQELNLKFDFYKNNKNDKNIKNFNDIKSDNVNHNNIDDNDIIRTTNNNKKPRILYIKKDNEKDKNEKFTDLEGIYSTKFEHTGGKLTFFGLSPKLLRKFFPVTLQSSYVKVINDNEATSHKEHSKTGPRFKNKNFDIKFKGKEIGSWRLKATKPPEKITVFNESTKKLEEIEYYKLNKLDTSHKQN